MLEPGLVVNNEQLCERFKCSPQGGMRRSIKTNTLVLVSNHIESIYDDRWDGDVLHYTGMGRDGNQSLSFQQNKTLSESAENGVLIQLFEVFEAQSYTYIGQVKLAGKPYQEAQPGGGGGTRKVWMFPLKLVDAKSPVISGDIANVAYRKKAKEARRLEDAELLRRVSFSSSKASSRRISTNQYNRNPWIAEYALRRAGGKCELCNKNAPFKDNKGIPFLEIHHVIWLSKGGDDSIENTAALCPNCHRMMHIVDSKEDREKLDELIRLPDLLNP